MKLGQRIMYPTMNSWNGVYAPAYNMKLYNVIRRDLQDKAYDVLGDEDLMQEINWRFQDLISEFEYNTNHKYTAGFNGRSGGYLVLYKMETDSDGKHRALCGRDIDPKNTNPEVLKLFRRLAQDMIREVEYMLEHWNIVDEEYTVVKTRKVWRDENNRPINE